MGKIAIVGFHNLHLMQFLYKYTEILDRHNVEYDVLYWERDDVQYPIKFKGRPVKYSYITSNYMPKWKKVIGYLKCRSFFVKQIKKNKYEKIILLTTQTAIALSPLALARYKKRYIFDFRDLTMEKLPPYKAVEMQLIKNASFVAISSPGFIDFLSADGDYVLSHNCKNIAVNKKDMSKNTPIRITFWGMVRQEAFQKRICDKFGNDDRFIISYHGEGCTQQLEEYCRERNYGNIRFTGRYYPEDIKNFIADTDILLNLYENEGKQEHALTVKLYDGVRYQLPMLVAKNSFMQRYLKDYSFTFPVDLDTLQKEELIKWYYNLKQDVLEYEMGAFCKKICEDDAVFTERVLNFVRK